MSMTSSSTIPISTGRGERLSTAQVLARQALTVDRLLTASVGIAVHHLTDQLTDHDAAEQHRATTVLTKQIRSIIDSDDALERVQQLVVDPQRRALSDGRTAEALCGRSWHEIAGIAGHRASLARRGAEDFGVDAIVNLAFVRALDATRPWWGTTRWTGRVDDWFEHHSFRTRLHHQLLASPEEVPDDILWDVFTS